MLDKSKFAIIYTFIDDSHETELSMFIDQRNILAFEKNGVVLTTRWNLDELAFWLRDFIDHMCDDPYPVQIEGEYAACKDLNAREFDSEDEDVFDAYYDKLDKWNLRHRWHTASSGAILADVYFQMVGDVIEISWNNTDADDDVVFQEQIGGSKVPKELFIQSVEAFLKAYATHWFS